MLRQRDRLLPAAAFLALFAIGVLVLVLVTNAVDSGRKALEEAVLSEVQATARSQDARLAGQIGGTTPFLRDLELDFEVGSQNDRRQFSNLEELIEQLEDVRTGFYLTDTDGLLTQGVRVPRSMLGEPVERPGFAEYLGAVRQGAPARPYLPVAPGITANVPTFAFVVPIRSDPDDRESELRGTFVFESEVSSDGTFNEEISQLGRGDTGRFQVFDAAGTIIAAHDPSLLGRPVPQEELVRVEPGLHRRDGEIRVVAEIPTAGWRIAFLQDADEFEEGLAGPLQQVGVIVVVVFIAIGVLTFVALARRLQAAREEQERLRRLSESQEEFISIVSHELRTPVAGVLGFLQTTMDHWDTMTDTERFNAVRRSASNARRLQGLTRDVLDSQSVETGRMSYAMGDADLREEVAVAVEAAAALYPRVGIDTSYEVDTAPVVIDVDRMQQVLTNLLDNAVKVSPPNGTIHVRVWREGERALVSVTDQGPGLSPELRDRVFDKFVRGRDTSVTGTGLGLYISRQILLAHDGTIRVDTSAEGGATFTFELPTAPVRVPQ
ncbi:MAG TPA: sensor histidine kinase [Acidimicrobiales bacterium]|nr:sensor histidine kinase [Acidimicrobiales bacterium]